MCFQMIIKPINDLIVVEAILILDKLLLTLSLKIII